MPIHKVFTSRSNSNDGDTFVGQQGTLFYDEFKGVLKLSDGHTPGGIPLKIDAGDVQLSFGDFYAYDNNLTMIGQDEDMNLVAKGNGSINIVGDLNVHPTSSGLSAEPIFSISKDGQVKLLVPGADEFAGAVEIVGSLDGAFQTPVNPGVMLHVTGIVPQGSPAIPIPSRIYNDAQGAYSGWVGRRFNGDVDNPTKVLANEEIARFVGNAYTGGGWKPTGAARLSLYANENQENTAQGGRAEIWVCPNGSNSQALVAKFDSAGITANLTGNVSGNTVTATNFVGTLLTSAQPNITSLGTLTYLSVNGSVILNSVSTGSMNNVAITLPSGSSSTYSLKFTTGTILTTPQPGVMGYDGTVFYATPSDSQRGVVVSEQWYVQKNDVVLNTATNQFPLFPVSANVSPNTRYYFRIKGFVTRTSGNNTAMQLAWNGTATLSQITYTVNSREGTLGTVGGANTVDVHVTAPTDFKTPVAVTGASANSVPNQFLITGIVDVDGAGGTLQPTIGWASAPGTVTLGAHSNMHIYPIGSTATNTIVGNWS